MKDLNLIGSHQHDAEAYVTALDKKKKFNLTIWPDHCLIGTEGHAVNKKIAQALAKW